MLKNAEGLCVGTVQEMTGRGKRKKSSIDREVSGKHLACISGGISSEG